MAAATNLLHKFTTLIIDPAILLIFTLGFFLFVWGLVVFLTKIESGGKNEEGKNHMLWGIVGMLIMVSVYGILNLLNNTFDLQVANPDINRINNVTAPNSFQ